MNRVYPVSLNGQTIGTARVEKQGLYYHFQCRCSLPKDSVYTIHVHAGDQDRSMGVCVPDPEGFYLRTSIPAKYFADEDFEFTAQERGGENLRSFVPVCAQEPFLYLDRLDEACFGVENGQPGVYLAIKRNHPAGAENPGP